MTCDEPTDTVPQQVTVEQDVGLTGRNVTLLARCVLPPGELRCICECYWLRQTPATVTSLAPYTLCGQDSNRSLWVIKWVMGNQPSFG